LIVLLCSAWGCGDLGSGTLSVGTLGDDDTVADDDDTVADDDDDDTVADDDDTVADDDDTVADDDDTVADDDDTTPAQDHELEGDYEGSIWMLIDMPSGGGGGGPGGGGGGDEPTCEGDAELEVDADGDFSVVGDCTITALWLTYSFEIVGTVSGSLQFVGEATESNSWTSEVSHYKSLGWVEEGDKVLIQWEGDTPGQGRSSRPYVGQGWFRLD
jgi:hypothetical protein